MYNGFLIRFGRSAFSDGALNEKRCNKMNLYIQKSQIVRIPVHIHPFYSEMKFEDCKISTCTFIGTSNLFIDLFKAFETIPLVHHEFGSRSIQEEGVVSVKYNQQTRGVFPNSKNKRVKSFRNTLTIIVCVSGRTFNFKIFSGSEGRPNKTQHPGAKSIQDAIQSFRVFWNSLAPFHEIYVLKQPDPTIVLYSVMTNINFNVGMNINRQRLYRLVKSSKIFKTFIDIDHGHTGVNIKLELVEYGELENIPVVNLNTNEISYTTTSEYYKLLSHIQILKDKKQKMTTFIVFHSGKVIMSSCNIKYMRVHFETFMHFIYSNRSEVEDTSIF